VVKVRSNEPHRPRAALERVRKAARLRKEEKFTALLHHINVDLLREAFFALKRDATPGVDGMTWRTYEADVDLRLTDLASPGPSTGIPSVCRRAGRIYRRPTEDSARSLLPLWKTKSFRARRSRY
jgi:hypothetical protein